MIGHRDRFVCSCVVLLVATTGCLATAAETVLLGGQFLDNERVTQSATTPINRVEVFEIRPRIPEGPRQDIRLAVVIHIGHRRTLRPEVRGELEGPPFRRVSGRSG